jgi:hypothetical protein
MLANDPLASGDAIDIELQACPPGEPFEIEPDVLNEYCVMGYSYGCLDPDESYPENGPGPYAYLEADFDGDLDVNTVYRWRARALYVPNCPDCYAGPEPPNPPHGPWRRFQAQAIEADINTVVADLEIVKDADPFQVRFLDTLTYTIVYTNHCPGIPVYIHIQDWIDDVPTYTVVDVESGNILDTLVEQGDPPYYYEWDVEPVLPCSSGRIDLIGVVTYTYWFTRSPAAGVYEFDDEVEIIYDDDVYEWNNYDWANAQFIFSPVGGYTSPASPMLLLWPRVVLLAAAAGGGVVGVAAALKKRRK